MSNGKNDISEPPKISGGEPNTGAYAETEWQREYSDVIRCPSCFGPVVFKDWVDKDRVIATHYRCNDCRTNWWADA